MQEAERIGEKRGEERGEKRGIKIGQLEASLDTARNLLKMGLTIEQIAEATGVEKNILKKIQIEMK